MRSEKMIENSRRLNKEALLTWPMVRCPQGQFAVYMQREISQSSRIMIQNRNRLFSIKLECVEVLEYMMLNTNGVINTGLNHVYIRQSLPEMRNA